MTSSVRYEMKQVMEALKKDMKGIPPHLQALVRENSSPNSPMWQTLFRVKRLVGAVHPWCMGFSTRSCLVEAPVLTMMCLSRRPIRRDGQQAEEALQLEQLQGD